MIVSALPLLLALVQAGAAPPPDAASEALVPRSWLVLAPVDARGRRPVVPDAVVARHVLRAGAPPPAAGELVRGEVGEARWEEREASERGEVGGGVGWAWTRVEGTGEPQVLLAALRGASTLVVDGARAPGDLYRLGRPAVPVRIGPEGSELLVGGVRGGGFALRLVPPPGPLAPAAEDALVPDLVVGESGEALLSLTVRNASLDPVERVVLSTEGGGPLGAARAEHGGLAPLGVRRLTLAVPLERAPEEPGRVALLVRASAPEFGRAGEVELALAVRAPGAARRRTFRSELDGSAQELAELPATGDPAEAALVLTLHGAGVDALAQARAYAAEPDLWFVAPTNRGRFGFDWQVWGRRDAYEALADALARTGIDRARVHVTGHSMGGHGAWHLAANDPDGFASVTPSAGWRSFDTYGGRPDGALAALWHGADLASDTEALARNLASLPVAVLHGGADRTVPVEEALAMRAAIAEAGGAPSLYVEGGAGHWWDAGVGPGTDCVHWPGFARLWRSARIPAAPERLDVATADPAVDATHHWVRVLQPERYGAHARVRGTLEGGAVELETENVRALALLPPASAAEAATVDGERVALADAGGGREVGLVRAGGRWRLGAPAAGEKTPERSGPIRRGLDRRFLLVVPTGGTAEEDAASLARARWDAGVWWYRARGDAEVVTDAWLLAAGDATRGRNVVLYGNATTNRAWDAVVDAACPVQVERGAVRVGERAHEGDALAVLLVRPRRDDPDALALALAATGPAGDRLGATVPLLVSGVGIPDLLVLGEAALADGDGGVLEAGWFAHDWSLGPELARR